MSAVVASAPGTVGAFAWWLVMLLAPALLLRRYRRRRAAPRGRAAVARAAGRANIAARRRARRHVGRQRVMVRPEVGSDGYPSTPERYVPRLRLGTLEPLCRRVDLRRRVELAIEELHRRLDGLPSDRWRIEPYPLSGGRRDTLLMLGSTGVFVVSAAYPPGGWDDALAVVTLARQIQPLLPDYAGEVRAAICHPFSSTRPRHWYRPDEHGHWVSAWQVGGIWIVDWLEHFERHHGLSAGDLVRFDQLAKPNWLRPAINPHRTWPVLPESPSGIQQ